MEGKLVLEVLGELEVLLKATLERLMGETAWTIGMMQIKVVQAEAVQAVMVEKEVSTLVAAAVIVMLV